MQLEHNVGQLHVLREGRKAGFYFSRERSPLRAASKLDGGSLQLGSPCHSHKLCISGQRMRKNALCGTSYGCHRRCKRVRLSWSHFLPVSAIAVVGQHAAPAATHMVHP